MPKPADITGQKFGKLVALRKIKQNHGVYWECVCDCGSTSIIKSSNLLSGRQQSCGCNKHRKLIDLTGKVINTYVVKHPVKRNTKKRGTYWLLECNQCGETREAHSRDIRENRTRPCKCQRSIRSRIKDTQKCTRCKFMFPRRHFWIGRNTRDSVCCHCRAEMGITPSEIRERIQSLAETLGCMNPGCNWKGKPDYRVIDFHHKDPKSKSFGIASRKQRGKYLIIKEIKKCITLCSNCHRLAHAKAIDIKKIPTIQVNYELCAV